MSRVLDCMAVEQEDVAARYVVGALSGEDEVAFEEHYLTCATCQAAVRLAAAVRSELASAREPSGSEGSGDRAPAVRGGSWTAAGWVAAALAAAAAGLLLLPSRDGVDPALSGLGRVDEPPIYLGLPVRDDASPGDSVFLQGMGQYDRGLYGEAAGTLRRALDGGAAAAPAGFFLGVSLLLDGRPDEAAAALARVRALGDTPYRGEASYYMAKALLRSGHPDEAVEALRGMGDTDHPFAALARALADSVLEVTRR